MSNRRFGWHSGSVHCFDLIVNNDMTIAGSLTFGDASTDTLTVNGSAVFNSDVTMTFAGTENLEITQAAMTENLKAVNVAVAVTDATHGARQGAIYIAMDRAVALTGWDGNPDCGFKIQVNNRVDCSTNGGVRAMDAQARARENCGWVKSFELNARVDSGKTVAALCGAHIRAEQYGTVSDQTCGLDIELSPEGASATVEAGIIIRNSDASTATASTAGIYFGKSGTNAGFDYLLDNSAADSCNVAVMRLYDDGTVCNDTNGTGVATTAGYITVVVGSATRYIWLADAAPTA
jgi:hypothetical protein